MIDHEEGTCQTCQGYGMCRSCGRGYSVQWIQCLAQYPEQFESCISGVWIPGELWPIVGAYIDRIVEADPEVRFTQVKMKFDSLRIYVHRANAQAMAIINEAEQSVSGNVTYDRRR